MKPTERTLKYFRDKGYICDMIERWVRNPKHPAGGFRKDYLGFADILAFNDHETLLIQSCGSSFSQHLKKIKSSELLYEWIKGENRGVVLIGWRKLKNRLKSGKFGKGYHYEPRIVTIKGPEINSSPLLF